MASTSNLAKRRKKTSVSGIPLQDIRVYQGRQRELVLLPDHLDDLALWDSFRAGDEKALVHIFDRYANALFNYGRKIAAQDDVVQDAVQELFISIWKQRHRLGSTDCIKSYLFKCLRRKLLRTLSRLHYRLVSRLSTTGEYIREVVPSHEILMVSQQLSEEKRARLMQMMDKLTRRQQEALFLRYFEELSCEEIGVVMELSKQGVYNLIHKALKELRTVSEHSKDV